MKYVYTMLLVCAAYMGQSQVLISILLGDKLNSGKIEFGLEGGWSMSTLQGLDPVKGHSNYNLGFYFDFAMKNPSWFVSTGVRVKSTMGAEGISVYSLNNADLDDVFATGSVTRRLNYFNVPVMMKYMFKNHLYAQAGIQLGLRYKGSDEFLNTITDKEDLSYKVDIKNQYHPLDGGLCAGLGYRLIGGNGMNIGLQYYYGLVDVRISDASPDEFNRTLYVNVGIPIGKGKAAAKAAEN
ncbi:MAG: PorT family protein [Saprospiraceae bacterium]|nr:PorT family protein [Candidatus Opimibacter skivensis]